jgi:FkbM family methyltransferase
MIMSWDEVNQLIRKMSKQIKIVDRSMSSGIAIFGAGPHGEMALRYLRDAGFKVLYFVDNNPAKHGTKIGGITVVSPEQLKSLAPDIVFIAARHAVVPISKQLTNLGQQSISFDAYFVMKNLNRIKKVRDNLLNDDRSKLVYDSVLKAMLTGIKSYCAEVMEGQQYFALPTFQNADRVHFVDAGAYVGDTVEKFIWANNGVFSHIYAFEPGIFQFHALKKRVNRLIEEWALQGTDITLIQAGLGSKDQELPIAVNRDQLQSSSFLSFNEAEKTSVPVFSLDRYLNGRPATFIKADIEGMEMDMLFGAKKTIEEFRPCLALSIYHRSEDIYQIAEYVHSIVPEYRMAVRQHAPMLMETTLYCWVEA